MFEKSPDMRGEIKIVDMESLMPKEHILRKIDSVIDFKEIYEMTEKLKINKKAIVFAIRKRWFFDRL